MFCFRLGNGLEFTKRDKSVDKIRKRQTTNNTVNQARINARAPPPPAPFSSLRGMGISKVGM